MNTVEVAFGYPPVFELLTLRPEGAATRLAFLTRYSNEKLDLLKDSMGELNRRGFSRHLQAVHYGNHGDVYEWQAVVG